MFSIFKKKSFSFLGGEGRVGAPLWVVQCHGPGPGHLPPRQGRVPLGGPDLLRCGPQGHGPLFRQCLARSVDHLKLLLLFII